MKTANLTSNTVYPSRKIQRIYALTSQETPRFEDQYAVSRRPYTPYQRSMEDTAYLRLNFTRNHEDLKSNTPYPEEDIRLIDTLLPSNLPTVECIDRCVVLASQQDIVSATLKQSYLWDHCKNGSLKSDTDSLEKQMTERFPGEEYVYLSCDNIDKSEPGAAIDKFVFSQEFINGLQFLGVPNHILVSKVGAPIMLLRNIDQTNGLCNGTRLPVLKLNKTSILASQPLTKHTLKTRLS
ncbi:ATP-dependent DNA helicase PIF1-like protein [Tanacetum coccineum]